MSVAVKEISAVGTGVKNKGYRFVAIPNPNGMYVLNRKVSSPVKGNTTNRAENKVEVGTLQEAWDLLKTDEYQINLVCPELGGQRALRALRAVKVVYR